MSILWTTHAVDRWADRFGNHDRDAWFSRARPATRGEVDSALGHVSPKMRRRAERNKHERRKLFFAPEIGAMFACVVNECDSPTHVVTVFHAIGRHENYSGPKARNASRGRRFAQRHQ